MTFSRRDFLKTTPLMPMAFSGALQQKKEVPQRLKLSCNLYSFNNPLRKGEMTLEEVFAFCSDVGFAAVDPTGYYFPGYPAVPSDAYIFELKRTAFLLGLDISGTGIRTDFSVSDAQKRAADVELVRQWVEVAAKLDAPVLRVFAGKGVPKGFSEKEVLDWVVESLQQCVAYGEQHGVMIVLQNHNELLKTVDQVLYIRQKIDSKWLGINLDIGSLRAGDPYEGIARLAPYAYTWQIKEKIYRTGKEEVPDLKRLMELIIKSGYRGYIPIETLDGDPRVQVPRFLAEVQLAMSSS
ncbi:sugar phosphate isomerase/epimerase family protein [Arundinibacter roseus]|uniref:Sugar phosphate isomerase/epimerase n=1 Tax=Arundinibacter roseus TaxID=2070510 RepID=A0A4R4K8N1_9BACT|nr:sugar phosphate isomerase/epimerase family protein [Arundinibacter roseus]TDB63998.1 sugar phosphate isomerase/epimerase [Arundinibacter roseus]